MMDLFSTQLCRALEQLRKHRSVLAPYFESCYNSDRKYETPPTPPKKPQHAGRVQAIDTPTSPGSKYCGGETSLCRTASPPTISTTQLGATNGASMRTGKKRKHEDEEPDNDDVRPPRLRRFMLHAMSSGGKRVCWDKGRKCARDATREPQQVVSYLHQPKLRNASRTPGLPSHGKACNITRAGQAEKESYQKAYHEHTQPQPELRRSERIEAMKTSHTSCGEAVLVHPIRQEQKSANSRKTWYTNITSTMALQYATTNVLLICIRSSTILAQGRSSNAVMDK